MWWKLILLTLYLVVLILLSRILELFTFYQTGYLANGLISPLSLTVQRLRSILESRGVSHRNVVEKRGLSELVANSGDVTQRELEGATGTVGDGEFEEFACEAHFLEKVEDTKDSVWVVQVVRGKRRGEGEKHGGSEIYGRGGGGMDERDGGWIDGKGGGGIDMKAWRKVARRLSKFGIQCGVFRCVNDEKFCDKKGWHSNQIILSTPEGRCMKDQVVMTSLSGSLSRRNEDYLIDWVTEELSDRLEKVEDFESFEEKWLRFDLHQHHLPSIPHPSSSKTFKGHESPSERADRGCYERIRALFISNLTTAPLFFSVMAAKFSGRVKLGLINSRDKNFRKFLSNHLSKQQPSKHHAPKLPPDSHTTNYLIITPHRLKSFGLRPGEDFSYHSLFGFLRSLHPDSNDLFIFSIIISTIICSLNLFQPSSFFHHHLLSTFTTTTKSIFCLLILWLTTTNIPITLSSTNILLSFLHFFCLSDLASLLRDDFNFYSSTTTGRIIIITTLSIIITTFSIISQMTSNHLTTHPPTPPPPTTPSVTTSCIHLLENIMEGICRGLFHNNPNPPLFTDNDHDHYNMIIQRLAVPNLWLRPLISLQYLHDLPLWRYEGESEGDCERGLDKGAYKVPCERCRVDRRWGKREVKEAALRVLDGDYSCKCGEVEGDEADEDDDVFNVDEDYEGDNETVALHPTHEADHTSHHDLHHDPHHDPHQRPTDLPHGASGAPKGIIASSECAICLDQYWGGDWLCALPCCHGYHQRCIMGWLSRDNHCCPICRWPSYKAKPSTRCIPETVESVRQS